MKKLGFGSRLLAMLLVLTMVMSYIPASVLAAAVVGDTKSDKSDMGLAEGSLDTTDTIRWPIKVYDYLNDGMLFEYSYAGDEDIYEWGGGAYGGGLAMPMISGDGIVGVDYTSINGYYNVTTSAATGKYAFLNWGNEDAYANNLDGSTEGAAEVTRSIGQPEKNKTPMHLHLEYDDNVGSQTKAYGWISNFAKDDTKYYKKADMCYLVMVYRTNDVYEPDNFKAYWSVSGSGYSSSFDISKGDVYASKALSVPASSEWTYVILDMQSVTADIDGVAKDWSSISSDARIAGVGLGLPLSGDGEAMDISHIAYFPSEDLAEYFGEKCVMFDRDPGEYMGSKITMTHDVTGKDATSSAPAPTLTSGTQSMNFVTGGLNGGNSAVKAWSNRSDMIVSERTTNGHKYINVACPDEVYDSGTLWTNSSMVNLNNVRYVTFVYRIHGNSTPWMGLYVEDTVYGYSAGKGSVSPNVSIPVQDGNKWVAFTYDLRWLNTKFGYTITNRVDTINKIGINFPGFVSASQSMDLAYINFSNSATTAANFETAATNYLNGFKSTSGDSVVSTLKRTVPSGKGAKMWNMGSNQAFTLLYASKGGGWYDTNYTAGGTNTWANGYYSYQIGKPYYASSTTDSYRNNAPSQKDHWGNSLEYRAPDDIILLNTYSNAADSKFDMSDLDLGYTLYNTMKGQGVMTAGLLQSALVRYEGTDGQEHTVMNYKEDTVHYIATMLRDTLVIPYRDYNGYNYTFVKGTASAQFWEDVDGDGKLDEVNEDLDNDGHLDVNEDKNGNGVLDNSEDLDGDGHLDVAEDRNGNGILDYSEDLDGDGHMDAWEDLNYNGLIDPGEDKDGDGKLDVGEDVDYDGHLDVWEDKNNNGLLDPGEDLDGDGKLDVDEDLNGNGRLDVYNEDTNRNGILDPGEDLNGNGRLDSEDFNGNGQLDLAEDIDGDGRLDLYDEDVNGNGVLDLGEDIDGDGRLDLYDEDIDGDGHLDVKEDRNGNGQLDKRDLASALRERLGIVFTDSNLNAKTAKDAQYQPNKAKLGSYEDTLTRNVQGDRNGLIGPYLKCEQNIKTFYDAAYYLLHNTFVPDSYNQTENDYQYLVMASAIVSGENKQAYVFDAGFTDATGNPGTAYDEENKLIYQTAADDKHKICYQQTSNGEGYWTTMKPFLPINDDGETMDEEYRYSYTPYVRDDMATTVNGHGATYALRNYNFVMSANGEFVYNYDKDLFFDFEGDDDVYMFINGELVLDIGGAHSITKVGFNMNDYVDVARTVLNKISGYNPGMSEDVFIKLLSDKKGITATNGKTMTVSNVKYGYNDLVRLNRLNLVDGQTYSIDFYYMERHGWGANMRIATNIDMTRPDMITDKTAYQGVDANGELKELEYGAMIDDTKPVNYSFALTNGNDANTKLYRLSFQDMNIGVDLSNTAGLQIFGKPTVTTFTAESGTTVDVTGLNGIVELEGKRYRVTVDGNFIGADGKVVEYLEVAPSPNARKLSIYQYNSTELYKDQNALVRVGSGTTVVTPKVNADGEYPLVVGANNRIVVKGVRVCDANGGILEPRDLTITVDGYASQADYEAGRAIDTITIKVDTQEELMAFLTDLQDPKGQTVEGEGIPAGKNALYWGSGLWKNATVTVSGMWYTLSEEEQDAKVFDNVVRSSAYKSMNATDELTDSDEHRVYTPGEPMYYQWAGHMVNLDIDRFWTDTYLASTDEDNTLYNDNVSLKALNDVFKDGDYSSVSVEIVNRDGGEIEITDNWYLDGKWVTMPSEYSKGAAAGNHEIFYKQIHNWTTTYIYYWSDANSRMITWPGIPMTKLDTVKAGDGKDIYRAEIPADAQYVIFSNGTGNTINAQTGNIALPAVEYDAVEWNATNKTLEVNYTSPGMHMFYVKVSSSKTSYSATVPVSFYVTATKDKTYVLDFGLKTEDLNADGALFRTDELLGAHASTSIKFMGITTQEPSYLSKWSSNSKSLNNVNRISFSPEDLKTDAEGRLYVQLEDGKLYFSSDIQEQGSPIRYSNGRYIMDKRVWFVPEKIMDAEYDLWMGLTVHYKSATYGNGLGHYNPLLGTNATSSDKGFIDIGSEVQMYKKLTILPATVVYYEDDFMDVSYGDDVLDMNDKTAGKFVHHGEGSGELTQGVDQNTPYGQDITYQSSANGQVSGQSLTTVHISDRNAVGSFGFAGTGFEIVSRTNSFDSASFVVEIFNAIKNAEGGYVKDGEPVKRLPVITEFTSANVICKHAHHTPNGYCSYCGNKVSHSYENGTCTVCNVVEATYYLIGYINGADQYDTREFEFVDGRLVATFDQDSYVMVMDNAGNQYWTNGYPGDAATSADLFNVGQYNTEMEWSKNKLHVPGGIEVTLNLMDNGDGGLVLSYFREPVNLGERTLFFDINAAGWQDVSLYYWSESNTMMVDWPGVEMFQYQEEDENGQLKDVPGVFYYTVPSDATKVIFTNKAGGQTPDLTIPGDHFMCYYDSAEHKSHWELYGIEEEEEEIPTTNTVYFENTQGWEKVYIYAWKDGVGEIAAFPGVPMDVLVAGGTRYVFEVPLEYDKVIFNDGGNGAQTNNQPIHGDGYSYRDDKWYDPNGLEVQTGTTLIYFKNYFSGTPYAYVWAKDINRAPVAWPGTEMAHIPGTDYYYIRVSVEEVDAVIFHDGNGNQTPDLTIDFAKPTYEDGKWIDYTPSASVRPIYFQNTENWTKVYAYFWSDAIGDMTEWPGVEMEKIAANGDGDIYMTDVPTDARYIKFTDGSVSKGEAGVPIGGGTFGKNDYFTGDKWVSYLDQNLYIYFRNTEYWDQVYAYYWSEANNSMVGWTDKPMAPVAGEEDLFFVKIPLDAEKVIFHNGNDGEGNKTDDLVIPGNEYVFNNGDWYPLGQEPEPVEVVYYLRGDMNSWGTDIVLTEVSDGVWSVTVHLEPGTYEYKVATEDWGWSCPAGDNASVPIKTACDVTFVLDLKTGTVTATGDGIANSYTVFFDNSSMNWSEVYAYTWNNDGNNGAWPGNLMTMLSDGLWSIEVPTELTSIIFNDGVGSQTGDLTIPGEGYTYDGSKWMAPGEEPDPEPDPEPDGNDTYTLYYDNASTNWSTVNAYAWNGSGNNGWPGVAMTNVAGTIWKVELSADFVNIIFNNNNGSKTDDLTIPGDSQIFDGNVWSIYDVADASAIQLESDGETPDPVVERTLYFENIYGWAAPMAYILHSDDTIEEVALDRVLGNYYMFSAPGDAKKVAFAEDVVADPSALLAQSGTALVEGKDLFGIDLSWSEYQVGETADYYTLYFDNTTTGWTTVKAYAWNTAGQFSGWPGIDMTYVSGNIWSVQIPLEMTNIIFNNDAGSQTNDLSIPGSNYIWNGSDWASYGDTQTETVFFDNTYYGWSEVYAHYWKNTQSGAEGTQWPGVKMDLVSGNIYKVEVPLGMTNIIFNNNAGNQTGDLTIQGDGHIFATPAWNSMGGKIIFFANPEGWEKVYVTYGNGASDTFINAPGVAMEDLGNGIWSALIPEGNDTVNFYNNKYTASDLPGQDNCYVGGNWYNYVGAEGKEIQQVPVIRVDDLAFGHYVVEISGMPQYNDDVDWMKILDLQDKIAKGEAEQSELDTYLASVTKDTYLYIDGIRIFQPLGATNDNYALKENSAAFAELRTLIMQGKAAVATYIVNKASVYTGNFSWTENRNGDFVGSQISSVDDYLVIGPNNETYINSNLNDQAVIFYVKEDHIEGTGREHSLQVAMRAMDAGLFTSGNSTGLYATVYQGEAIILPNGEVKYGWKPVTTLLSGTEEYYEIDYKSCPYTYDANGDKVYQVALSVRQGMVSFTSVKTNGLTIMDRLANECDYVLVDGVYREAKDGTIDGGEQANLDFKGVGLQLASVTYAAPVVSQPAPEVESVTDPELTLKYPSLSFEDEIFYNVYFTAGDISDVKEMGLMILPSKNDTATIDDAIGIVPGYITNGSMFMVKSESVAAAQLGDTVYFMVYALMADGTYRYSKAAGYSAKAYASTVLNGDYSTELKALAVSMVEYGAEAQLYFGHNTGSLVDSALTESQKALIASYDKSMMADPAKLDASKTAGFVRDNANFKSLYPSVSFDGAFSINFYCVPAVPVDGDMTLYWWDAETAASEDKLTVENAVGSMKMDGFGQYWGQVSGIAAKDMDKTYYVSCVFESEGEIVTSGIIPYSLGAYCDTKAAVDGDAQQAFAQATAVYGYYAKDYFASIA